MGSLTKKIATGKTEMCQACKKQPAQKRIRVVSVKTGYSERVWLCRACGQIIEDNTEKAKKEAEYQRKYPLIITDDPIGEAEEKS